MCYNKYIWGKGLKPYNVSEFSLSRVCLALHGFDREFPMTPVFKRASTSHLKYSLNPLPDDKILVRSNLKQSADDNFKFDENSRKFPKRAENTVGKGEIARYEQFLLFPQCFQKACFLEVSKGVIVWEWAKMHVK